jgi:hypothetical protein
MNNCPTCGRPMPHAQTGDDLVRQMRNAHHSGANCYRGRDGNYYIEYNGGSVSREAIDDALERGLIVPRWADKPNYQYWRLSIGGGG